MIQVVVFLLLLVSSLPARADIYRAVGKDGVIHFTNAPRGGQSWQLVIKGRKPKASRAPLSSLQPLRISNLQGAQNWERLIQEAARLYQLPTSLIRAVMRVESGFNPNVVSNVGAMGLMQLMPGTALRMGVINPFDPRQNVFGGARYLRVLANMFGGNLLLTLAGYNAGEHAVLKYGGIPPYDETQRYVRNVLRNYYAFQAAETNPVTLTQLAVAPP